MSNYKRVLPRDAFNEAKLLKCIGKLTLMIEDGMLPAWHYHYDGDAFNIVQDDSDGSISIGNITFWRNKKQVQVMTGLNSKEAWSAIMRDGDDDYYIFSESGEYMPSDIHKPRNHNTKEGYFMTKTSSDNLSLTVINDGDGSQCGLDYNGRVELARQFKHNQLINPNKWVKLINKANLWCIERGYEAESASVMLDQAAKVAAYYEDHILDMDDPLN